MCRWCIQIGVDMSQEELMQIKQDMERLICDVKKLAQSDRASCAGEVGEVICHSKYAMNKHPLICLGVTAIIGGLIWAMIARKHSS